MMKKRQEGTKTVWQHRHKNLVIGGMKLGGTKDVWHHAVAWCTRSGSDAADGDARRRGGKGVEDGKQKGWS